MSGTVKKAADVAFKASKNIDWEGMAKLLVSDEARKEFSGLRRAFDEVNSTLQTKFSQVCDHVLPSTCSDRVFCYRLHLTPVFYPIVPLYRVLASSIIGFGNVNRLPIILRNRRFFKQALNFYIPLGVSILHS